MLRKPTGEGRSYLALQSPYAGHETKNHVRLSAVESYMPGAISCADCHVHSLADIRCHMTQEQHLTTKTFDAGP